jgi:hypothetical protein
MFGDLQHGARQHAFRSRLASSGVTTATVTSPAELETALLQALTALPRPEQQSAPTEAGQTAVARRVWTIPARVRGFPGAIPPQTLPRHAEQAPAQSPVQTAAWSSARPPGLDGRVAPGPDRRPEDDEQLDSACPCCGHDAPAGGLHAVRHAHGGGGALLSDLRSTPRLGVTSVKASRSGDPRPARPFGNLAPPIGRRPRSRQSFQIRASRSWLAVASLLSSGLNATAQTRPS